MKPKPTPNDKKWDIDKYAIADYNEPEPVDSKEREEKKAKGKRYDGQLLVFDHPNTKTSAVILSDHSPLPETIPIADSDLIIIGEITSKKASLSNYKKGIYSEYKVQVLETLKDDPLRNKKTKGNIFVDRAGGAVRYPSGQTVVYLIGGRELPRVGSRYLLFLTNKERGPNYKIFTGYELNQVSVIPLDGVRFEDYAKMSEGRFIDVVRNRINDLTRKITDELLPKPTLPRLTKISPVHIF